jgi:hypothetical protein
MNEKRAGAERDQAGISMTNGEVELRRLNAEEEAPPSTRKGVQQQQRRLAASSNFLPNDLVICAAACSRLSCFTRTILLCFGCILVLMTTYNFSFDKGMREQILRSHVEQIVGGDGGKVGGINKDNEEGGQSIMEDSTNTENNEEERGGGREFTLETLHNTRAAAQSLVDMLDIYYGGRDQATNMLVNSWQAQWMLDDAAQWTFDDLGTGGRSLHVNDDKVVVINGHNDDKGPKEGKILVNPDNMTPEE